MGHLFWKFFFIFWLAQLTTFSGVGISIWLKSPRERTPFAFSDARHAQQLSAAASAIRASGITALPDRPPENDRGPEIFAVDENNREALGRPLPPFIIDHARWLASHQPDGGTEIVVTPDQKQWLLFAPPPPQHQRAGPPPHGPSWLPPLIPLLAGGVVSLLFAALLAWYFSKPIRHLREAFDAAANGQLDTRLAPAMGSRRDELADLGRDFDRMTERLQSLMNSQRRLLHDVSHELRSPLARLQVAVGLLRQRPEKLEDSMDRIERESVRMDKLVSELLTLSRLEAGMAGSMNEDFSLNEVIASVSEDARYEAGTRNCQVVLNEHCHPALHGSAELLHRALDNVIRNAIKHSPAGGTIHIVINPHTQGVSITVSDSGSGVTETELQSIFEPFFRSNNASSTEGHGLGLAIAHRIVQAHRGSIRARNQPDGGLLVEMVLPVT